MALVLRQEEPQAAHRTGGQPSAETVQIQNVLRSNAGQWYLIHEGLRPAQAGQHVNQMRRGRGAWSNARWDARSAKQADGTYKVWGQFVGRAVSELTTADITANVEVMA